MCESILQNVLPVTLWLAEAKLSLSSRFANLSMLDENFTTGGKQVAMFWYRALSRDTRFPVTVGVIIRVGFSNGFGRMVCLDRNLITPGRGHSFSGVALVNTGAGRIPITWIEKRRDLRGYVAKVGELSFLMLMLWGSHCQPS